MNFKNTTIIISAIIFGLLAGYGAVSILKPALTKFADYRHQEKITVADFTENIGGPPPETKYIQEESKNIFRLDRKISYSTKKTGYNKIDETYLPPNITADSYLIADLSDGKIIESFNSSQIYSIASLSKLATAIVADEKYERDDVVSVSWSAVSTYGKQGNLVSGDKLSVNDLLHVLILESSNDAAEVLAEFGGRNAFMTELNEKLQEINMEDTFLDDPSGLSNKNVSTARDLLKLILHVQNNYPDIIEISAKRNYQSKGKIWYNNSKFRSDSNYLGGKNGYTDEAKSTLIALFELPLGENSELREIAIILLHGEEAEDDARDLILYLLRNIEYVDF